jgi:hypothetical protein
VDFLRESLSWVVQQLMEVEVSELVGAVRGERAPEERLLGFQRHYEQIARPFEWTFRRADLDRLLKRLADHEPALRLVA